MITILSKFAQFPSSICDYQASKDGRYGWLLCTAHEENSHELEEIQAEIKLEIMNSGVLAVSKMEIENWLKGFFADFHWKLHARLLKTGLREKGLSLFFAVIYDCEIYLIQFGRIFCAVTHGKKLDCVGKNWKNYQIQTLKDLNLFGLSEDDIRVRPLHLRLAENESLIILSGQIAGKVLDSGTENASLLPLIESYSASDKALWMILKNMPQLTKTHARKFSKLQISSFILILATLLAILYMTYGNRILDVWFHRARREVSAGPLQEVKKDVNENIVKVLNAQARDIELEIKWSMDLSSAVTSCPVFDLENVYLAQGGTVAAYSKKNQAKQWVKTFPELAVTLQKTQSSLVASLQSGAVSGLDFSGKEIWRQSLEPNPARPAQTCPLEITPDDDKRIDRSIMVVPGANQISVLDSQNGTVLSSLQLPDRLTFLSQYDDLGFCFYAAVGDALLCVQLKIVN